MSELHVLVRGRVQGVGFRWFVVHEARALGLTGWVRNNEDGSVEVAARGDEAAIATLRQRLAAGPPAARVDGVDGVSRSASSAQSDAPIAEGEFRVLR